MDLDDRQGLCVGGVDKKEPEQEGFGKKSSIASFVQSFSSEIFSLGIVCDDMSYGKEKLANPSHSLEDLCVLMKLVPLCRHQSIPP